MGAAKDFVMATIADAVAPSFRRPVEDIIYETLDRRQVPTRTDFKELRDLINNLRGQISGATQGIKKLAESNESVDDTLNAFEEKVTKFESISEKFGSLTTRMNQLHEKNTQLEEKNNSLHDQLNQLKEQFDAQKDTLEQRNTGPSEEELKQQILQICTSTMRYVLLRHYYSL